MVKLELPENETVTAIYNSYHGKEKDWRRPHLGASQIGTKCVRALWYQFRWAKPPEFPGRILRLFQSGHLQEPRIVNDLRNIGVEVYDTNPYDETEQIHFTDHHKETCGHFSGSCDGVAIGFPEAPKSWHILEIRTSNTSGFDRTRNKGVLESKPEHYAQMQCYMNWSGIDRAYYFVVCKETDEIYAERIHADKSYFDELLKIAMVVLWSTEAPPRIKENPDSWDCKYCDYKRVCHKLELPEVNCRTCVHSTPGQIYKVWCCNNPEPNADGLCDVDKQRIGCPNHVYNPDFVGIDILGVDPERGTITYADGNINGPGETSSIEWKENYTKMDAV